jgi:hypothetical protein
MSEVEPSDEPAMENNEFQLAEDEVQQLRRVLFGEESSPDRQRRQSARFSFPAVQLALPLVPGRPLDGRSIRKVQCHDISRSGIAFFWPTQPDFATMCIGLGANGNLTWMKGQVVHSRRIAGEESRYLVGCAFTERVDTASLVQCISGKASGRAG